MGCKILAVASIAASLACTALGGNAYALQEDEVIFDSTDLRVPNQNKNPGQDFPVDLETRGTPIPAGVPPVNNYRVRVKNPTPSSFVGNIFLGATGISGGFTAGDNTINWDYISQTTEPDTGNGPFGRPDLEVLIPDGTPAFYLIGSCSVCGINNSIELRERTGNNVLGLYSGTADYQNGTYSIQTLPNERIPIVYGDSLVRGTIAFNTTSLLSGGENVSNFANLIFTGKAPNPSSVPGPLPIFGAATAFGFSRRLRKRISAST